MYMWYVVNFCLIFLAQQLNSYGAQLNSTFPNGVDEPNAFTSKSTFESCKLFSVSKLKKNNISNDDS